MVSPIKRLERDISELPFTAGQFLGILIFALLSTFLWWWAFCGRLRRRRDEEERYERLFRRREDMQHHIDWCKNRGERKQARELEQEARKLDAELEVQERKLARISGTSLSR
mmetsp:Transcript_18767/g.71022  ORF Transcript_18767/g.71022 Transcript_18767/m.71022 type:complete len:112 (+) Transcript_18767:138-473(+)